MPTFRVPTPPSTVGVWSVRLDFTEGSFYRLLYKYNARDETWYLDVATDDRVAQVRGRRIVLNSDILAPWKASKDIPQGRLSVVDTTGSGLEPTKESLGDTVLLQYTTVDDA